MGHHHPEFPEMPDFRKYVVEDVPDLMKTKRRLALMGLSDPWLRNEVWKYQTGPTFKDGYKVLLQTIIRGFKYGVVLGVVATAITKNFARKPHHH